MSRDELIGQPGYAPWQSEDEACERGHRFLNENVSEIFEVGIYVETSDGCHCGPDRVAMQTTSDTRVQRVVTVSPKGNGTDVTATLPRHANYAAARGPQKFIQQAEIMGFLRIFRRALGDTLRCAVLQNEHATNSNNSSKCALGRSDPEMFICTKQVTTYGDEHSRRASTSPSSCKVVKETLEGRM